MVLILYLVVGSQALPDLLHDGGSNRNINLFLQEVPEPGYQSLPKPDLILFPDFSRRGGLHGSGTDIRPM